jgi:hypothetical protein
MAESGTIDRSTRKAGTERRHSVGLPISGPAVSELLSLTPENVDIALSDLPRLVRLAFGFGSRLRRGTLDVTLPDGRKVRLGGMEPGPSAAMTLTDYSFASRLLNGGDIGIAEAYLHGEWDTPDLTQFLYLFCVNHDLIQAMLGDNPLMRFVGSTATPGGRHAATSTRITTSATRSTRRGLTPV